MELTKEESKRILRRIELEAYSSLVTALRAQGELDRQKKKLLSELGEQLSISTERHRAEIRRAISDDRLSMIAECVCGSGASVEWESEGRRVVPLMPRLVPQTAFTGTATAAAKHAATLVNSAFPSSAKVRSKDSDEDLRSRKRQKTNGPATIQKVIVSSVPKVSTSTTTVRSVVAKDSSKFLKTPSLPSSSTQLSSVKITSPVSSKPIILGGTKPSSVSVAPSKYVAPLPASCLQAHASVVSGNKNRMNVNIVKTKPKPKFKQLAASVKVKSVSSGHGTNVASSVVQTVAKSLLTAAKIKSGEISSSTTSTVVHVSKSTSTITVAPRSSISLTAFKPTIQPKPQVSPRTVEASSRPASGQIGKAVSVSRLSRPLPAILPKTIPISTPGRKLASILPAPAKPTSSTVPNPRIVPVVVSSASSPIPIAPSPNPPQTFTTSSVMSKVTTVSMATGQSADTNRDTQESVLPEVKVHSPILIRKSPAGSQDSSPLSSKSLDNIHEREALSPVNEILTLVKSPSSVPFAPSSPVKSSHTLHTSGNLLRPGAEISLECDENLLEDLVKDEEIHLQKRTKPLAQKQNEPETHGKKDIVSSSDLIPNSQDAHKETNVTSTNIAHLSQEVNKTNLDNSPVVPDVSTSADKPSDVAAKSIDISLLVEELICSSPFDALENKQLENPTVLDESNTAGATSNIVTGDTAKNLPVSEATASDIGSINVPKAVKSDANSGRETPESIAQSSLVQKHLDEFDASRLQEVTAINQQEDTVLLNGKSKEVVEMKSESTAQLKNVSLNTKEEADCPSMDVSVTKERESSLGTENDARSPHDDVVENIDNQLGDLVSTTESSSDNSQKLNDSKQGMNESPQNAESSGDISSTPSEKHFHMSVNLGRTTSEDCVTKNISNNELAGSESIVDTQGECIGLTEEKKLQTASSSIGEVAERSAETTRRQTEVQANEMVQPSTNEQKSSMAEGAGEETICEVTVTQATESCQTDVSTTRSIQVEADNVERTESSEEQFSGSEAGVLEGNFVRTSNRKRKAPPPRDLSVHPPGWVRSALQLLQKVSRFRGSSRSKNARSASSWFLKPVATAEAPGYFKVIKNPMDFGTIKTKLEAGEYHAPADFHRDMLLVKSNCCKYNPPGHIVRKDCDEVFQFYEVEYERFVEKLDKIYLSTPKKQKVSSV